MRRLRAAQRFACTASSRPGRPRPAVAPGPGTRGYPPPRLLPALLAGYETGGLLEKTYAGHTTPGGFRASPVYGTIAAAAASAKLMDLSEERIPAAPPNAGAVSAGAPPAFAR